MAYIAAIAGTTDTAASGSVLSVGLPPHQADDLLMIPVWLDGAATFSAPDWTLVAATASNNGMRHGWLGRVATSSATPDPDITASSSAAQWGRAIVIRDADISGGVAGAIHAAVRVDGNAPLTTGALTTTVDDCLLLYSVGIDGNMYAIGAPEGAIPLMRADYSRGSTGTGLVGYRQQFGQGAVPQVTFGATGVDGGNAWVIAIKNKSGGSLSHAVVASHTVHDYGVRCSTPPSTAPTYGLLSDIMATLGPYPVTLEPRGSSGSGDTIEAPYIGTERSNWNFAYAGVNSFCGFTRIFPAPVNMTGRTAVVLYGRETVTRIGDEGFVAVFFDSSGNWAAYKLGRARLMRDYVTNYGTIKLGSTPTYDESASQIDWSDVAGYGLAHHRASATGGDSYTQWRGLASVGAITLVGGSLASPITPAVYCQIGGEFDGFTKLNELQGVGQALAVVPIQVGDGSSPTYFRGFGSSQEIQGSTFSWVVPELGSSVTIYASASDVIDFASTTLQTPTKQSLTIHASSSPSATYNFSGASIIGFDVTWRSGVLCGGAIFARCYTIEANGGTFEGCQIRNTLSDVALRTSDPGEISNCEFVASAAGGHAIEITQPGTYTFSGNTFSGYGANGTTDAAIYNNSGGAVTLNITGGGDTPTVRNGTGATTTINNNVQITLEGVVVGSAIRVEKVSDGSLVEFRVADATTEVFSVSGGANYRVKVRKASSAPKYFPFETQTGTITNNTTIFVQQVLDPIA